MKTCRRVWLGIAIVLMQALLIAETNPVVIDVPKTVVERFPSLPSGALTYATVGELPDGVLVAFGDYQYQTGQLDNRINSLPPAIKESAKKNAFFFVEQDVIEPLLTKVAKERRIADGQPLDNISERQMIEEYFNQELSMVSVSKTDVETFYSENKEMCGGADLNTISKDIEGYLLNEKRQAAALKHIVDLGKRVSITVSKTWIDKQAVLAMDNPADKARASGLPSVIDFGSKGCKPCDMMAPILDELKKKYEGKANVLFIQANDDQILAARYGIQSIPVQIFYDKTGKEIFRHTGFYPKDEMEKKMAEAGVAIIK